MYECACCGISFQSKNSLAKHKTKRCKQQNYCPYSDPSHRQTRNLAKHSVNNHEPKPDKLCKRASGGTPGKNLAKSKANKCKRGSKGNLTMKHQESDQDGRETHPWKTPQVVSSLTITKKKLLQGAETKALTHIEPNVPAIGVRKGSKVTTTGEFYCASCLKHFPSVDDFRKHKSLHLENAVNISDCGTAENLAKQVAQEHCQPQKTTTLHCDDCGAVCKSGKTLSKHRKEKCKQKKLYSVHRTEFYGSSGYLATYDKRVPSTVRIGGPPQARELPKVSTPASEYDGEKDFSLVKPRTHHANTRMRERNLSLKYVLKHEAKFPQSAGGVILTVYRLKKEHDVLCSARVDPVLAERYVEQYKDQVKPLKIAVHGPFIVVKGPNTPNSRRRAQTVLRLISL